MRALVLCDDYWHPAPVAREGLDALQAKGEFEFDWIEDAGEWSAERMSRLSGGRFCQVQQRLGRRPHRVDDAGGGARLSGRTSARARGCWWFTRAAPGTKRRRCSAR